MDGTEDVVFVPRQLYRRRDLHQKYGGQRQGGIRTLWKEDQKHHQGRNREQLRFYGLHGHWPEQGCDAECISDVSLHLMS